jgi:hypothetical protein
VEAITFLAALSPDTALDLLRVIVADKDLAYHTRMEAVVPPSRHLGPQRTTDLYRILATEDVATRTQRDAAASAATKIDVTRGRKLYEELVRNADLSVDDRLYFTRKTGRPLDLLREFARESGPVQIRMAQEAASQGAKADRAYLLQLAASPSLSYTSRKPIIEKLSRADRIAVLVTIIGSPVEDEYAKLTGAIALGSLDREKAAEKLTAMADDPTLSRSTKNQARNAARRFR